MDKMQTYLSSQYATQDMQDYERDLQEWNPDNLARNVQSYEKDAFILI